MPRTSIVIGGIRGLLRAQRRQSDQVVELFGEAISAHAEEADAHPWHLSTRLIEFVSGGERGPPS